nr:hypothetical protein [Tanacetum cinerariifolium]
MIHMPKGAKVLKDLLSHKEKLEKATSSVKLSEECFAVIQRSLLQKEGDPGSFTFPCLIGPLAVKNALTDLGASINLMPHSLFQRLGISKLKPAKMINFLVLEMDEDELVLIILGRPFLATTRAVINVHEGKLSLRVRSKTVTFNIGKSMKSKHSRDDYIYYADHTAKLVQEQWVDIVNLDGEWTKEEEGDDPNEVLAVSFYSRIEPVEPLEWKASWSSHPHYPSSKKPDSSRLFRIIKGRSLRVLWTLKGSNRLSVLTKSSWKTSSKQLSNLKDELTPTSRSPWVSLIHVIPKKGGMTVVKNEKDELIPQRTVTRWCMLERLAGNEYYCFLDGFSGYFQIPITPEDQEKTVFTCPYGTFAYKRMPFGLCNAPATFQRCMTAIFHELIKDSMEVFMDDFLVFGSSFDHCLRNFKKMLKRCEETNLVLNWEKCHFMVKEGFILGIRSPYGIKASIMIKPDWSLPFEIMCDASDYVVGLVLRQRIDKHFKPIHYASKTTNEAQENYTTTKKELLVVVFAFDKFRQYLVLSKTIVFTDHSSLRYLFTKQDAKPPDHLSQLKNPDLRKLTKAEIRDLFPKEKLVAISDKNNKPCVLTESYVDAWPEMRQHKLFDNVTANHPEDIMASPPPQEKSLRLGFTSYISFAMHVRIDFMEPFPSSNRNKYVLVAIDYVSKWVEAQAFPTNDARNAVNFLKRLFTRFGIPKALIRNKGTHFCNHQMEKAMKWYGVVHRFSTAYYPQTNGQVKNTNRAIKRILKKIIRNNRKDWSYKLDEAL